MTADPKQPAPGFALVKTPGELGAYLNSARGAIERALPKHMNADRMMRLALTAFSTTPALRDCTPRSILASIVVSGQLGLEPGVGGQAYLIPYKDKRAGVTTCTLVPGWRGLVGLLNNSGRATAWTGAVFQGDDWEIELGSSPRCRHVPGANYGDHAKMIWVYACGKVNGSEQPVVEAWPISRVIAHRDHYNKVGSSHYSYGNLEMYARKVVLLQVLKYMPQSIELQNASAVADLAAVGRQAQIEGGVVIDMEPEQGELPEGGPPSALDGVTASLAGAAEAERDPDTGEKIPAAATSSPARDERDEKTRKRADKSRPALEE